MSRPCQGRAAIVAGATRGIGRATALQLVSLGASITLVFYSRSVEAERLAAEINSSSSVSIIRAITIRADVSDPIAVRSVFDLTEKTFKSPPHIVVHSAAIFDRKYQSMSSTPQAIFDSIMSVNAQGAFHVFQEAANRAKLPPCYELLSSWLFEFLSHKQLE
ncbi:short-chain type dehydrogenase/reductase-like [Phalaenopsis equestris]|uniref:short-chain type dehydrogenase/reductase-like n=1 Tax=Phalaenopsis equestris TaxID=78828 RepID=UPI0009E3A0DE|nr:short-chain type dehydrogenase/reductase-like [Phalaenopsis equestris]